MIKVRHNTDQAIKSIAARTKAAGNIKKAHYQISTMLARWVDKNVEGEGSNVGGWVPFAEYTVGRDPSVTARGRVRGTGKDRHIDTNAKLLRDSGALRKSLKPFYSEKNAGVQGPTDESMAYVTYHHKGKGHLPERRLLPVMKEVRDDVIKEYKRWLRGVANAR